MNEKSQENRHLSSPVDAPRRIPRSLREPHPPGDGSSLPVLRVRLFGGLEVSIADRIIDAGQLRRSKVRTLLALLALERGREISSASLGRMLWPEADDFKRRNDLYSTWCLLRKAVALPDGSCPYLVRNHGTCKLVAERVETDVQEIESLCSALIFDALGEKEALAAYARLRDVYRGQLLPGGIGDDALCRYREEWNRRIVDALLSAARSMRSARCCHAAFWFAQAACELDRLREDSCALLMRIQIDIGQRAGALACYYDCRRRLVDELGLDPSESMTALYEEAIGGFGDDAIEAHPPRLEAL